MADAATGGSCILELPGFFRDPVSGKYFREDPGVVGYATIERMKRAIELAELEAAEPRKPPKNENVVKHLRAQEIGPISGTLLNREYFEMRTYHKNLIEDISLNDAHDHKITGVEFVTGGSRGVLGVWNIDDNTRNRFALGEHKYLEFPDHENLSYRPSPYSIIDMCEGPQGTVVCLYHDPSPFSIGCFEYVPRDSPMNFRTFFSNSGAFSKSSLFCCAVGTSGHTYAVGSEGFIRVYEGFNCESTYFVNGRVHTVCFDDSASVMVSGVHQGTVYVHDARDKKIECDIEVSDTCITDSKFLQNNQVIVSSLGDKMLNIDLRMKRIVTEYFGHTIHTTRRRPMSIANNMVCTTGSDNIIRIWHTSGGNPIHEISPLDDYDNEIRGWLYGEGGKTHLYYFEGSHKKIFQIC